MTERADRTSGTGKISKFLNKYFDPSLELPLQAFNLLACAGMAASAIAGLESVIMGLNTADVVINVILFVVASSFMYFARETNRHRFYRRMTVVGVFFIAFPVLFFTSGGYHSGMPCFFIFALVFTALMIDGRERVAAIAVEFFIYIGACLTAYLRPDTVTMLASEKEFAVDVIIGISVPGTLLLLVVLLYIRIYNNRQKQLEELDRLKTEFYQDMHHEMKTPLTVISTDIQNAGDMLDFDIDKEVIRDKLESAQQEIIRLARMVENSLDIAAAQVNRKHMEQIDFASLLRSKAGVFRAILEQNGNTLSFQIADGLPYVTGNADMLLQVIFNLMYNAHKHTKNGAVTVSLEQKNGALEAVVRDTGEGIAPEYLPGVFERGTSAGGTGYGLSICKTILEMHGGGIGIESAPDKGTAVTFSLPVNRMSAKTP